MDDRDAIPEDIGSGDDSDEVVEIGDDDPELPVDPPGPLVVQNRPEMIDLTETDEEVDPTEADDTDDDEEDDDDDLEIIEDSPPQDEESGISNDDEDNGGAQDMFFGNDEELQAVAAQLRVNMERLEREQQEEEDDLIVEEPVVKTDEEKREARKNNIKDLLSWFILLKPEHISNFETGGSEYLKTFVADASFLGVDACKEIASDYKESQSLTGLAEKYELPNDDLLIFAICLGVLDNDNELDINFTNLCIDRIDEWTIKKCNTFFDKQTSKPKITPLKFMQFTATTPAFATLLLTMVFLKDNGRPCNFEPEGDFNSDYLGLDGFELSNKIVDASAKYWALRRDNSQSPSQMDKALDDFFREIDATSVEIKEHHDATVCRQNALFDLTKENIMVNEEVDLQDLSLLTEDQRKSLIRARAELASLTAEIAVVTKKAAAAYANKSEAAKKLVLGREEYCLARLEEGDDKELTYAVVLGRVDDKSYQVRFVDSNATKVCHIRDLAMTTFMVHNPIFSTVIETGFRVAVRQTIVSQNNTKSVWVTGTTAGRTHTHKMDFLVLLDNGNDVYVTVPMKPDDMGFKIASMENEKRSLSYQETISKMNASQMAVMVAQPLRGEGEFEKALSHLYIRSQQRAHFVRDFMKDYPEWPLCRMPVGTTHVIHGVSFLDRSRRLATVISHDRAFAIVRTKEMAGMPGYDCYDYPCLKDYHNHHDEKIYRGSHRIEGAAAKKRMLNSDNNLSARKKNQLAAEFEVSELERTMPTRTNQGGVPTKPTTRSNAIITIDEDNEMPADEVQERQKRQNLISKIIVRTPNNLKSREELKYHSECGPDCLLKMDENPYDKRFHSNSPLHTPLLCGWRRSKYVLHNGKKRSAFKKVIVYFAPCGKPLADMAAIANYLRDTRSKLTVDCFSYEPDLSTETFVTVDKKYVVSDDFAKGLEGIAIPLVNSVDKEGEPKLQYCKRRFPYDDTVTLPTIAREFCSGCTCDGDCANSENCECQKLSARDVANLPRHLQYDSNDKLLPHYNYRNLSSKVITGLYECNDQCSCNRNSCHNRVVQNNIKYPLHIFKTAQSGWGCRALTDIPEGAFICTYVGALLTNDLANKLQNDDQYFADLDLKDSLEMAKGIKVDNDTDLGFCDEDDEIEEDDDEDFIDEGAGSDNDDDDDKPVSFRNNPSLPSTSRRVTRQNKKRKEGSKKPSPREKSNDDDEDPKSKKKEGNELKEKKQVFKWDDYFTNTLYVVDAKVRGNLGRFLNHSCNPNVEVQHVLYDTHDLRLPWVAFFSTRHVEAGDELCWDYRYAELDTETVRIQCKCGAKNCRRRLL